MCTNILYSCMVMKGPVDGGPGKVRFALMDQNGPEKV